jgi:histidyl-tRNA synthetase
MLIQPPKGFRDFLPEKSLQRNFLIEKLKTLFERFGFDPLETPTLEYAEVLLGKYGEEADKLIYIFEDKGGRKLGLRYDQTVPLARVVSQYQNLPKPFKRYQIQSVFRAENPQKGRFREFIQADIDIVGEESLLAEAEIIAVSLKIFKELGFKKTKIFINDRKNFENLDKKVISAIDKLEKVGEEKVIEEIAKTKAISCDKAKAILDQIKNKKPNETILKLFSLLKTYDLKEEEDFVFKPTLARGLDYYTGIIFEAVDDNYKGGSLGGGGRYDNLIGIFLENSIPACGFAFGFDRLLEAGNELNLFPKKSTATKVLVTIFSKNFIEKSIKMATVLREKNINTELFLNPEKKLDKQLKYADKKGIPYVLILGEEEVKKNVVKLKDLKTGSQKEFSLEEALKILSNL